MSQALRLVVLARVTEKFDPADHPRMPKGSVGGGRFKSLADRVIDALKNDDTALDGLSREQLRDMAGDMGVPMRRGISKVALIHEIKARAPKYRAERDAKAAEPNAPRRPSKRSGGRIASPEDAKAFLSEHYDSWREGLTPAQRKGLALYQSPAFAIMNGRLRRQDAAEIKADVDVTPALVERSEQATRDLRAAIAAAPPLTEPVVVHRSFSADQFGDLRPGRIVTDEGFVSTSLTEMDGGGGITGQGRPAIATVTLPAGTRAAAGSYRELVLAPGSKFRVKSVTKRGRTTHVEMELIPPPGEHDAPTSMSDLAHELDGLSTAEKRTKLEGFGYDPEQVDRLLAGQPARPSQRDVDPRLRTDPDAGPRREYRALRSSMLHGKDHDFSDLDEADLTELRGFMTADPRRDRLYDQSIAAIDKELKSRGGAPTKAAKKAGPARTPRVAPPSAVEVRRELLARPPAERRAYLDSLGPMSQAKANQLAKALGVQRYRGPDADGQVRPDSVFDNIVAHFADAPGDAPSRPAPSKAVAKVAAARASTPRLTPEQRSKLANDLGRRYVSGESIADLATSEGRSSSFVQKLLTDHGFQLRPRGAPTPRARKAQGAAQERQAAKATKAAAPKPLSATDHDALFTFMMDRDSQENGIPAGLLTQAKRQRLEHAGLIRTEGGRSFITDEGQRAYAERAPKRFDADGLAEELGAAKPDRTGIASRLAGLNKSQLTALARSANLNQRTGYVAEMYRKMSADELREYIANALDDAYRNPRFHWR